MQLVYSKKGKLLGEFVRIDGEFVKYKNDKGKVLEGHKDNVAIGDNKELQILEESELGFGASIPCDKCGSTKGFLKTKTHRDADNDITHWDAQCKNCGAKVEIIND